MTSREKKKEKEKRVAENDDQVLAERVLMYNERATKTKDETRGYREEKQQMIGLVWNTRITTHTTHTQHTTHAWCGNTAETTVPQTSRTPAAT